MNIQIIVPFAFLGTGEKQVYLGNGETGHWFIGQSNPNKGWIQCRPLCQL